MFYCDTCNQPFHFKKDKTGKLIREDGKLIPERCPLDPFKYVKSFYTQEIKQLLGKVFLDDSCLGNDPDSLKKFSEYIPEKTKLMDYIYFPKDNPTVYAKNVIIESAMDTFFAHYTKFLINIFYGNKYHYVDCITEVQLNQFNYLWLSPTILRECYFKNDSKKNRFRTMSDLAIPSLVIYPIGSVESVEHSAWGDILVDMMMLRDSMGKATWLVNSRGLNKCPEMRSSEKLREHLKNYPQLILDDIEVLNTVSTTKSPANGAMSGKKQGSAVDYLKN